MNESDLQAGALAKRRVVLLGASNLTMGLGRVFRTLRAYWPEPLDVLAALGHGRSYGRPSEVLGRGLPGIAECGLWTDLDRRAPLTTSAFITDIGNDIVYGRSVDEIAGWVEQCLARLSSRCERVVLSELPIESTKNLPEGRFRLLRTLFFPGSRVSLAEATAGVTGLNERLGELAKKYGAHVVRPAADWFGIDAIHFRHRRRGVAWQTFLAPFVPAESPSQAFGPSWYWWSYLASRRPLERQFLGRAWQGAQPAVRLKDGTTISFY